MLPIFWLLVLLWLEVFVFVFGYQFLLHVVNDMQWKLIILDYCTYDFSILVV